MASSADVCDVVSELCFLLGRRRAVTDLADSIGNQSLCFVYLVVTQVFIPVNSILKVLHFMLSFNIMLINVLVVVLQRMYRGSCLCV